MPEFLITTECRATVRERWKLTAETEDEARRIFEDDGEGDLDQASDDEVVGDEEDRSIVTVEPFNPAHVTPPASVLHEGYRNAMERGMLLALSCRLFRTLLLSNIILPEAPQACEWLKAWVDGDGHGPLGGPMRWPDHLPGVANLMRSWGYEPTPTVPAWVRLQRPAPVVKP